MPAVQAEVASVPAGVRILVVDDDARIRRAVASAMSRTGFHVFTADDGKPALAVAAQTPPDLAIVDFDMPTPGVDVVRELKALHGSAVWVVVLSGHDDEAMRQRCFDAGADDVIAKPASIVELRRRMLAAARTQQAYVESRLARERADRRIAYGVEATAMLAHDLNNGLAVALGNIEFVTEMIEVDGDTAQALGATLTALRRMSGLVANFVDIARFEDAAVKPQCSMNRIIQLLDTVVAVHRSTRSNYEIVCDPELDGYFDPALIERVLHNLVGNAARYCNPGGVIRLSARAWDALDGGGIELDVFNNGPSIPDSLRDRLFAKYAKGSNGKRGFGLYFCRLACEAHAGQIDHIAQPGGTLFRVRLPART
jgi:signal transduction histidine kinase